MKLDQNTEAFVDGPLVAIDIVNPETGRSLYAGETLEEVRKRYPNAERVNLDKWSAEKERALCTEPERITEERFIEMLEVLPPQRWQRGPGCESFELSEHTSGRVTAIYCRFGDAYFGFQGIAGQTLAQHAARCGQVKAA